MHHEASGNERAACIISTGDVSFVLKLSSTNTACRGDERRDKVLALIMSIADDVVMLQWWRPAIM